jgi:hypothetical protein
MVVDRYLKLVLTVIAAALVVVALNPWVARLRPAPAAAQGTPPKYEVPVPRAWGKVIGYGDGNLLLEAPDGSLREVDVRGTPPEYPKVKSLVRWQ